MSRKKKQTFPLQNVLEELKGAGIFSASEATQFGLSRTMLSRLTASGKLRRVRQGFYVHPDSDMDPKNYDFALGCKLFGSGAFIGGLSALFYYGLIEQVPKKIWVVVPRNKKTIHSLFRCIRTGTNPKIGIEDHGAFRISDLERTIVEGLRYSSKIGTATAVKAARTAILDGRTTAVKIGKQATALGFRSVVKKYWDSITA